MNILKLLINFPLLLEQLKRYWLIAAGFTIFYLLVGMLPIHSGNDGYMVVRNFIDLVQMNHPLPVVAMLFAPFSVVMALYPYHFNGSAATAFYSFPVTKRQLFWTNAATAMILMLLPLLILCVLLLVPIRFPISPEAISPEFAGSLVTTWRPHFRFSHIIFPVEPTPGMLVNTFPVVVGFFVRMTVGFAFYFSVFLLAVSVSGNRVVSVLLCGTFPFIPISIHFLFEVVGTVYVFGHTNLNGMQNSIETTTSLTNPVVWGMIIEGAESLLRYYLAYIGITAALLLVAYICSHKRKQERTGDSVVFTTLNNICVFLVAMSGMIVMGAAGLGALRSRVAMYFGFVIGFAIFYIIAQMIAEKSFNIGGKIKSLVPYGAIMAGLYITMLLVTNFGMTSYINFVPSTYDIRGVSISNMARWQRHGVNDIFDIDDVFITEPEVIARVTELHQYILNNRDYLRDVRWRSFEGDWRNISEIPITYRLHDGTYILRSYMASEDFLMSSGISEFMHTRHVILADYPLLRHPYFVERVSLSLSREVEMEDGWWQTEFWETFTILNPDEITSLLAAVTEDIVDIARQDWEDRLMYSTGEGDDTREWVRSELNINIDTRPHEYVRVWRTWMPHMRGDRAVRTMEWLAEQGYYGNSEYYGY